jgi:hypothetical protein
VLYSIHQKGAATLSKWLSEIKFFYHKERGAAMQTNLRFEEAKKKVIGIDRQRLGIGTLSEKTVHAILKNYYEPDEDKQEIPIENYVADIYANDEIIEIQTRGFDKMRAKLAAFLPLYPVTVVYPIPREKWIIKIDPKTGECGDRRKSPKKGSVYTIFPELYKIKMFLMDKNIRFRLVLMDVEEYKLQGERFDRIPLALIEEVEISRPEDYMQFVPADLADEFTSADFAKAAHISKDLAVSVLNILYHVGTVTKVGKKGRAYLYTVIE